MKARCTWSGYLKISLVTVPVRVYSALSTADKITFHQVHKDCSRRVHQKLVCPVHGELKREDLVRGYEYATDKFVTLNEAEVQAVRLETSGTIELVQFVRPAELDPLFLDTPYYIGPDGPVAEQGFSVLREALRRSKCIGIGRVVLNGKERLIVLKLHPQGFVLFTLRYTSEVRWACACLEELSTEPIDPAQIALAQKLIQSKSSPLNLTAFSDRYQAAVLELIKAKIEGTSSLPVAPMATDQVVSLMEALQRSVAQSRRKESVSVRKNGRGGGMVLAE